jgi:hypothetical protein
LKNISQWEGLIPIYGKIKNVPNHQPDWVSCEIDTLLDLLLCKKCIQANEMEILAPRN